MRIWKRGGQWRDLEVARASSEVGGDAVSIFIIPDQVGVVAVLCRWRRTMEEADAKREVGAQYE